MCSLIFIVHLDIPGEIAYRICAIRELFEETGVLLVRQHEDMLRQISLYPGSMSPALMSLSHENLFQWRDRVHTNAYNFITMCRYYCHVSSNLCYWRTFWHNGYLPISALSICTMVVVFHYGFLSIKINFKLKGFLVTTLLRLVIKLYHTKLNYQHFLFPLVN